METAALVLEGEHESLCDQEQLSVSQFLPSVPLARVCAPRAELLDEDCLLYTSPSPRDVEESRMPSSA